MSCVKWKNMVVHWGLVWIGQFRPDSGLQASAVNVIH